MIKNKFKVVKEIVYPDHYQYKKNDLKKIINLAKKMNAKIITSEKDYDKIRLLNYKNIIFLKINLLINDKKKLLNFIKSKFYEKN